MSLGRTYSVKFKIYAHQTTIFKRVLDNCPTYFLSSYYYLIFYYIYKPPYINYNLLFQIIIHPILLLN